MKTLTLSFYNALLLLILFLIVITKIESQWLPDQRLTNDPGYSSTSYGSQRNIASNGLTLHVVWEDSRAGNYEIYYKRSTDAGISWDADKRLTQDTSYSEYPCIAVSGESVHVVWPDKRTGNYEIYYKRSTNSGLTWEQDKRISFGFSSAWHPNITALGSEVHIVWDMLAGNEEIYYIRSTNNGNNWGLETRLTNFTANSIGPSVSASGNFVHVVWHDGRDGNAEIYYKRSDDNGIAWGNDRRITNEPSVSIYPSITSSGSDVHIVWYDERNFIRSVHHNRSTDNGSNWGAETKLTSDSAFPQSPSIVSSGQLLHIVWDDLREFNINNNEIYYLFSTNSGLNWTAETRLTNSALASFSPSLAITGNEVHLVWTDARDGNRELYYKRNPTGNTIGINPISNEIPQNFSLGQNYPNPFNPSTKIRFTIPRQNDNFENLKLVIYDILGREIKTLLNDIVAAGFYEIDFDANELASGIYYYRLTADSFSDTKKMIIAK